MKVENIKKSIYQRTMSHNNECVVKKTKMNEKEKKREIRHFK